MSNLSNEIVRLSKILEKQIPKGYHEIVTEYVRQNIAGAIYDLLTIAICLLIVYFIARTAIKASKNKEDSLFFEKNNWTDPYLNVIGMLATFAGGVICFVTLVVLIVAFLDIQTSIQHAVAPNYYLIKSFIK